MSSFRQPACRAAAIYGQLASPWLADEGILVDVRGMLTGDFARASQRFLP
jgi:hypothetical protein